MSSLMKNKRSLRTFLGIWGLAAILSGVGSLCMGAHAQAAQPKKQYHQEMADMHLGIGSYSVEPQEEGLAPCCTEGEVEGEVSLGAVRLEDGLNAALKEIHFAKNLSLKESQGKTIFWVDFWGFPPDPYPPAFENRLE